MKIEVGKRYKSDTKEGVVLSVTRNNSAYPVVFLEDSGDVTFFTIDGKFWIKGTSPKFNLQEIPKTIWINVYEDSVIQHATREDADTAAYHDRIACVEAREGS